MTTTTLQYAELLLKRCSRTYGVAPCAAAVGVTGPYKCYNSPRTCQDPANYLGNEVQVIRWAVSTADLPLNIDADPRITSMTIRPQMLDPGESLGVRESGSITLKDSLHNDVGFDKYINDRGYNTYTKGTYWGKFFARWGNIQGLEFRTVFGSPDQTINQMERRYYIVEDSSGPDSNGNYSITFKDIIKFADDEKAQAPRPSNGVLSATISTSATSLTLDPSGIGSEYPASGLASIGDEVVSFTRSGDSVTLTGRALYGSKLDSHDQGETFQIGLVISAKTPAEIINTLLSYTDTPAEYYDFANWQAEVTEHIGRLYSADIMKPTPIKKLMNEIISEAGLIVYTDLVNKKIAVKALRQFIPTITVNDDYIIAGSISSKPQYDKRISQVWTYYGKRNPLEEQDKKENYRAIYASPTQNTVVALENSPQAIKEVYSRFITTANQPAAQAINEILLARYETAPRKIALRIPPTITPREGQVFSIQSRIFTDAQGDLAAPFLAQVIQVERKPDHYNVALEEAIFNQIPVGTERIININDNVYNFNLRSVHDSIYTPIASGMTVKVYIAAGVRIGSNSYLSRSFDVGSWPAGVTIEIYTSASDTDTRIQGAGGIGGFSNTSSGTNGGTAFYTRYPVSIYGNARIWGGGGGGGGTLVSPPPPASPTGLSGGGGAGIVPGAPLGSPDSGGTPTGAPGGNPGQPGGSSSTPGGDAGFAIDGVSYVTIINTPNILGPQVN